MKTARFVLTLLLLNLTTFAQVGIADSNAISTSIVDSIPPDSLSIPIETPIATGRISLDTFPAKPSSLYNKYGDLLNDDPVYNKKYGIPLTAFRVALSNAANWAACRYFFKFDWARISPETWKYNLKNGWVWDDDGFGTNFIGHPHTGNIYFNIARSNGYSFLESFPFAVGGSIMWEYFAENTQPSKNDLINTPISGLFLGEVLYRISSNILDDRARGSNRFWRELIAGLINPPRALNRLTQGKMSRVTSKEVYQKEPLNITFSAGIHKVNTGNKFFSGQTNAIANLQFDYGDPFEVRKRKPFDVFRLKLESRYGDETKFLDNVLGYGLLFGKNIIKGKHATLAGFFQHFDYWNNNVFELGTIGFGPGIISRINLGKNMDLYSSLHIAGVPFGGNSTRFGPDTSEYRKYNFGGGFEARIEETLNLSKWFSLGFNGYFYWITTYVGLPGKSIIGILKPRATFNFSKTLSLGVEHHLYYNNRFINNVPDLHLTRTEQKVFLQLYLEDPKRRGRYH